MAATTPDKPFTSRIHPSRTSELFFGEKLFSKNLTLCTESIAKPVTV